jgi:TIR domain
MAAIFISYAVPDSAFALRLANGIELLGHAVWIDQWEIGVGDSLLSRLTEGVDRADYMVVVLSKNARLSSWMEREWQITYGEELVQGRTIILPVVIDDCTIPSFLRHKRFADFRVRYEVGFAQLAITLHSRRTNESATSYHPTPERVAELHEAPPHQSDDGALWYTDDMLKVPKMTEINIELGIPYIGKITGMWKPDADERAAAWELYIELVTRVPVAALASDEGLLREALSSLYTIFTLTRDILRKHGPLIAKPKQGGELSFGYVAIAVLNNVLRPILAKWHPLLLDYEHTREPSISVFEHERDWEKNAELRHDLDEARTVLVTYATILAEVAGIPPLHR